MATRNNLFKNTKKNDKGVQGDNVIVLDADSDDNQESEDHVEVAAEGKELTQDGRQTKKAQTGGSKQLSKRSKKRARKNDPFPKKLFRILEEAHEKGGEDIISFLPHGKTFAVHDITRFVDEVMPKSFSTARFSSFLRQLNFYGFRRVSEPDGSFSYYHELFHRDNKGACDSIKRKKQDAVDEVVVELPEAPSQNPNVAASQDKRLRNDDLNSMRATKRSKPNTSLADSLQAQQAAQMTHTSSRQQRMMHERHPCMGLEEEINAVNQDLLQQSQILGTGLDPGLLLRSTDSVAPDTILRGALAARKRAVLQQLLQHPTVPWMTAPHAAEILASPPPALRSMYPSLDRTSLLGGGFGVPGAAAAIAASENRSRRMLRSLQLASRAQNERQTLSALLDAKESIDLLLARSLPPSAALGLAAPEPMMVASSSAALRHNSNNNNNRRFRSQDVPDGVPSSSGPFPS